MWNSLLEEVYFSDYVSVVEMIDHNRRLSDAGFLMNFNEFGVPLALLDDNNEVE